MRIRGFFVVALLMIGNILSAEKYTDTTAIIKEFNRVMSFAVQPYLHYNSITTLCIGPMVNPDSNILHSSFYKFNNNMYYGNELEEMYLQDSLMISISHERKTIQLSMVDIASKKNINNLPLEKMDMRKMLRDHYTISQTRDSGNIQRIILRSQNKEKYSEPLSTEVLIEYTKQSHLPKLIRVTIYTQQPESNQIVDIFRTQGFDVERMLQKKDSLKYLVITQTLSVDFISIETTKAIASQMPAWKEKVAYNDSLNLFSAKGQCEGYEIIKTF